ncbi:MAG: hypothetical protein RI958_280 [Actinomycetota bacterium]
MRGAAAIATRLGIEPVVIGLTVVAFGTSAPEFAVSVGAAISGDTDVALGNVVGSNIVNILLILGVSAVVGGLVVSLDHSVGRIDGLLLFGAVIVYTVWLIRSSRRESSSVRAEYAESVEQLEGAAVERPLAVQIGLVVVGLAGLVIVSQLLVTAATSVLAAVRGRRDIAVGGMVGSNLFNLMCVLGLSGVVSSAGVPVGDAAL